MSDARRALIVGGGIGGLAAAIALRRSGWEVRVFERATSPRALGFGLLLAPNALAALRELDVTLSDQGVAPVKGEVEVRRLDGRVVRRFRGQIGGPSVVALRNNLHGALLHALDNVLMLDREVVAFREHDQQVIVKTADGAEETADILVGADGVDSVIRRLLHPHEPPARPSGFCSVRGVAFGVSHRLGELAALAYLDNGVEAATARASTDAVYWYMSLLSDDVAAGERAPGHVARQRMEGADEPLQAIVAGTRGEDMRFDELREREPLDIWGAGRVTLLGDAAHPLLPHTGQGAAQALEDAVALGLALTPGRKVQEGLRQYESVRSRRTRQFIRMGPRIARLTTTRSRAVQAFRTVMLQLLPERLASAPTQRLGRDPHRVLRATRA